MTHNSVGCYSYWASEIPVYERFLKVLLAGANMKPESYDYIASSSGTQDELNNYLSLYSR
ncbi:hypothetical protein SAMN05421882_100943 [Nitrosomonas communis]|uniref:Uncharacterized protein n=1 Tax=Nitrosomonas communis TaxID=44574 RepID=A0A1H2T2Y0_9PROT|nr:hypothetical protein SAMN05421882_100943 [Nitrosomonas communis]